MKVISTNSGTTSELIQLWHGSDLGSAYSIENAGLSAEKLHQVDGSELFWMTLERKVAISYAKTNPVMMGKNPGLFGANLKISLIQTLIQSDPPLVVEELIEQALGFHPDCFSLLNAAMVNCTVEDINSVVKWTE